MLSVGVTHTKEYVRGVIEQLGGAGMQDGHGQEEKVTV